MRGAEMREIKVYVFVMSFHFLKLSLVYCHLQLISTNFFHFVPLTPICDHFHAVPFISLIAALIISFHFSSFHLISFKIHSSSLFSMCSSFQTIEQSRTTRVLNDNYGLQNTLIMWIVSLSKLFEIVQIHQNILHNWYVF